MLCGQCGETTAIKDSAYLMGNPQLIHFYISAKLP